MLREVPNDLKNFKDKVGPTISTMSTCTSDLSSKIDILNTQVNSTKQQIESNYKSGDGSDTTSTKFANTSEIIASMKSDIESTINGAISKANNLIDKVTYLTELETTIEECDQKVKSESAKEEPNQYILITNKRTRDESISKFDSAVEEANELFTALKSLDKSLEVAAESGSDTSSSETKNNLNTLTEYLQNLKYGSFSLQEFEDSKGNKMQYYLYVPDGVENITGLPVMMYMHGAGKDQSLNGILSYGLSSKIYKQEISPPGIVICPYIKKFNSDETLQTLKELTDTVVDKYKCDKDRISLSGHSYGGQTVYDLINKYPGYYAAGVPISGSHNVTDAMKDVSMWMFHGNWDVQGDTSRTTHYNNSVKANEQINQMGGTAKLQTLDRMGHAYTQNKTFEGKYVSPEGEEIEVVNWAMTRKRKSSDTTTA